MKKLLTILSLALFLSAVSASEPVTINPITINPQVMKLVPPTGNFRFNNNDVSGGYGASSVQAKLNVNIKEDTRAVHFIRDTSDPYVVSKAYLIRNADPFVLRGVLKSIVAGTIESNPVTIESIKYNDGLGVIMVSAEEYRFKDVGNGMSIDQLVATLDKKDLPNSSGTIDMAYFPKHNPASKLLPMLKESGIGFTGTATIAVIKSNSEEANAAANLQSGLGLRQYHYARVDEGMNAIVMTAPGFDMTDALAFLKAIDKPQKEIHLTYKLIEVYAENDQKLGLDFQAWKNNDGINFFTVGGKYGNNNWAGNLIPNLGYANTDYFNFNPKWNTKYLDFLTTCGKANIVTSGKLVVAHEGTVDLTLTNGLFTVAIEKIKASDVAKTLPIGAGKPEGAYTKTYRGLVDGKVLEALEAIAIDKGNKQEVKIAGDHCFTLSLYGDVHTHASNLTVGMYSSSLIGWDGKGAPRLSTSKYNTVIQIGTDRKEFVIGGITKSSVVRNVNGIPFLKDLPFLGWLFSTESDIVKKSQYVLVASTEVVEPSSTMSAADQLQRNTVKGKVDKAVKNPMGTAGFQQLWLDTKTLK